MTKPITKFEHAYHFHKQALSVIEDFPVDHTVMRVPETPEMVALRIQIEDLQAQHTALQEAEQRRYWKTLLHVSDEGPITK